MGNRIWAELTGSTAESGVWLEDLVPRKPCNQRGVLCLHLVCITYDRGRGRSASRMLILSAMLRYAMKP